MLTLVPEAIEQYARDHSLQEAPILSDLREATSAQTGDWARMLVGPLEGALLRMICRLTGAQRVLEVGTFTGYSALTMAHALPDGGVVVTLDESEEWTTIGRPFWNRSPHAAKIDLRLGPALDPLAAMGGDSALVPFDVVFLDADKHEYQAYWDLCLPMLRPGGIIVVDNVLWSGRVVAPDDAEAEAIATFNQSVAADPRVDVVLLPIRDGVTLARKRESGQSSR